MYWTLIFIFGSSTEGQGKFVDFENAMQKRKAKTQHKIESVNEP
jgi:hypothetical protein